MTSLTLFSPSGVVAQPAALRLAAKRLHALGFDVTLDDAALAKFQRFAGDDDTRLAAIHRVAAQAPSLAMATRGGYGLTRLLDRIDWPLIARSIAQGTRWVGHSDFTVLQLALLAHAKGITWAGPMACYDFGRSEVAVKASANHSAATASAEAVATAAASSAKKRTAKPQPAVDEITQAVFEEAMSGKLEALGFRVDAGFDGLEARGTLWGGNLCMVTSLLGTPHWPRIKGGVLFLEDVNEHPYRIERGLLQLHQAGVLDAQKAILLGQFTEFRKSPLDRGYNMKSVVQQLRSLTKTPVLTGLPFGHVPTKLSLPVGARCTLAVDGRNALIGW